ncbi:MAG: hypothetical protein EpisKO_06190 [Epibacterium sp.]
MSRPVAEWIGKTDATPAPARVKARTIMAQDGICACGCGVKLGAAGEAIEFDHETALILGGENRESNLRALRRPCHSLKTKQDVAQKSVEARKRNKSLGLHKPKGTLPGSKGSKWKRKVDGTVVPR